MNAPTQRPVHRTERDREIFYRLLSDKLEIVQREKEKEEKLRESLLRLSEPNPGTEPLFPPSSNNIEAKTSIWPGA